MCRFPIRLPRTLLRASPTLSVSRLILACPICGHVYEYRVSHVEKVKFQVPDPFLTRRAVLYDIAFPCAAPVCPTRAEIFAIAAEDVSVASLLTLWQHWTIHVRCREGHLLRPARIANWAVSRTSERPHFLA